MPIVRAILTSLAIALSVVSLVAQTQSAYDKGLIEWSASRKLTRRDFKGKIPSRGPETSNSWVAIEANWECREGLGVSTVRAVFDPARSWWKDTIPGPWPNLDEPSLLVSQDDGGRGLLAHEQLHFDLTEVWARKVRAQLAGLSATCKTHENIRRMERAVDDLEHELEVEQKRYDKETANGTDSGRQSAWEQKIRKALQ